MAAPGVRRNSFTYTATGVLGDKRNTMLINEIHQRPRLAQPLLRGRTLPSEEFIFGQRNEKRDGVPDALVWPGSYNSLLRSSVKSGKRDFISLNREAIRAGLANSREMNMYRSTHDIRQKPEVEESKRSFVRRIPPTRVFGVATRPSTPIFDLIAHKYQDEWISDHHRAGRLESSDAQKISVASLQQPYETRASLLRTFNVPVEPAPLWQMTKFTRSAAPHLSTYWTDKDKVASYQHHSSDRIGRKGLQGHGIYEPAVN